MYQLVDHNNFSWMSVCSRKVIFVILCIMANVYKPSCKQHPIADTKSKNPDVYTGKRVLEKYIWIYGGGYTLSVYKAWMRLNDPSGRYCNPKRFCENGISMAFENGKEISFSLIDIIHNQGGGKCAVDWSGDHGRQLLHVRRKNTEKEIYSITRH